MIWMLGQPISAVLMRLAVSVFIIALILPLHEMAHGLVAYWLGDPTAKRSGRLTLNPLAHIDPMGALAIIFLGFGWAKPVSVNPYNFKNPKVGMAITAIAGPVSNILAAFVGALIFYIILPQSQIVSNALFYYVYINITLAVFNLIPVPPLDGSRVAALLIPNKYQDLLYRYERYSLIIVVVLIVTGVLDGPIGFISDGLFDGVEFLAQAITGIFR